MSDSYPKITLVTPSFNQGAFLEETILSVLSQGYPNLEYIIIDGGSTDSSLDIIRRYERRLAYWKSEKDNGQSSAINHGFADSTGEIMCWLNSDDLLAPGALTSVARLLRNTQNRAWVIGAAELINRQGHLLRIRQPAPEITRAKIFQWHRYWFGQPSVFWTRRLWQIAGPLRENLHFVMDFDLWLRMRRYAKPYVSNQIFSRARRHAQAKTSRRWQVAREIAAVARKEARGWQRLYIPFFLGELLIKFFRDTATAQNR